MWHVKKNTDNLSIKLTHVARRRSIVAAHKHSSNLDLPSNCWPVSKHVYYGTSRRGENIDEGIIYLFSTDIFWWNAWQVRMILRWTFWPMHWASTSPLWRVIYCLKIEQNYLQRKRMKSICIYENISTSWHLYQETSLMIFCFNQCFQFNYHHMSLSPPPICQLYLWNRRWTSGFHILAVRS